MAEMPIKVPSSVFVVAKDEHLLSFVVFRKQTLKPRELRVLVGLVLASRYVDRQADLPDVVRRTHFRIPVIQNPESSQIILLVYSASEKLTPPDISY